MSSGDTDKAISLLLDDTRWERLLQLTDGAVNACFQCGACTATCPWGLVKEETVSVRLMMRDAQLGVWEGQGPLWLCTTCAHCEAFCPRGVPIADVFRGLRQLAWEARQAPPGLPTMLWSIYWNENPWSQPPSQRHDWARGLDLPRFDPAEHEILLFVGCTACYDRRAQSIARALVRVLRAAEVRFGVLGEMEPCCGEPALSVGHDPYLVEIARQAVDTFVDHGVSRLATISPHSYHVFRHEYPRVISDLSPAFEPIHYTQYLAELVAAGRLRLAAADGMTVTYHDPCYLARHSDQVAASRQVLAGVAGLQVREMSHAGRDTICCGGGGGRMWLETAAGERFADLRVAEARATDADILVTACPFCVACLEDSLKGAAARNLVVMDLAELAARCLGE